MASGRGTGSPTTGLPPHLARATFKIGGAKVDIDYGVVVSIPPSRHQDEIEARCVSWAGLPASDVHADLSALSASQRAWVLFALDLHIHNPVPGLDRPAAVHRLIAHAPAARARPLTVPSGGYWDFEEEALSASGWFEVALSASLSPPAGPWLRETQKLVNPEGQNPGESNCPPHRPSGDMLDENRLRSELPPLLESHLKAAAGADVTSAQPFSPLLAIADLLQDEAAAVFAPYANRSRGSGNLSLTRWQYSANLTDSQSPQAAPDQVKRMQFLGNRARLVGGDLLRAVRFDARCDHDVAVLDAVLAPLESRSVALLDRILKRRSYTVTTLQSDEPKQVVLNTRFNPAETDACEAHWRTVNVMCHELLHVMVHDEFRESASGRQILTEGFAEILGDQLYRAVVRRALRDKDFRAKAEAGVPGAPCATIPPAETSYGPDGRNAERIRVLVGNDRFRAAYFLGRLDLVGIHRSRSGAAADDPDERAAVEAERRHAGPEPVASPLNLPAPHARQSTSGWLPAGLGGGDPLGPPLQQAMEARFGLDLSRVRVHTGDRADVSARELHAHAYTVGEHIVFASGKYAPTSGPGHALLAHELTHVAQQAGAGTPRIQRAPAPSKGGIGPLRLPWSGKGWSLFELVVHGIRVLVAVPSEQERAIRAAVPAIARRIAGDNALIADTAARVGTCIITPTVTRFARYQGAPVLMLDPSNADSLTAAHEMGHALFDHASRSAESGAAAASGRAHLALRVADIYARLGRTKQYDPRGDPDQEGQHPAGHWMVDPSQWSPGKEVEHPWKDPDEFFASAKEAHQTDREALLRTIDRFSRIDANVRAPGAELVRLLDELLGRGTWPRAGVTGTRAETARAELSRVESASNVESTLAARDRMGLRWLLQPETRPEPESEVADEISVSAPRLPATRQEDMVTGKGGVVERLEEQFRNRIRERAMESAEEL
ncbi:DUF4157 domain-containing protein [Streptomyces sp. NPDC058614]|uniref:DUF4157 domain-containing protein n=1 Tax=Streptomyces sp. NPDC058614 TaxID=3346557 RepID=UPI00365D3683